MRKILFIVSIFALMGCSVEDMEEQELLDEIVKDELAALDEVEKSGLRFGCFVDTPAYDQYSFPHCYGVGPSTASFRVFGGDPSYTYSWSDSRCPTGGTGASPWCTVPVQSGYTYIKWVSVRDSSGTIIANLTAYATVL